MQLYKCKYSPLVGDYTNVTRLRIFKYILPYVPLDNQFQLDVCRLRTTSETEKKRTQLAY